MGLMDRIKKVTGTNEGYDDTYDDDYYNNFDNYDGVEDDNDDQMGGMNGIGNMGGMETPRERDMGTSAPIGGNGGISLSGQNIRMKIVRPKVFGDGSQIARFLLNKCTIFLNLENTNKETARRLIDFLSGVAFSIDGTIKKVANNAYVITPSNVDVGEPVVETPKTHRREEPEVVAEAAAAADFDDFD